MSTDIYPVGIQTFSEIRERGFVYVDKTEFIYKLFSGKYYFLSRPRRFGKSVLLSTLEAYYQGRRDLFRGLAIDSLTDVWEERPVLRLDLNSGIYDSVEGLLSELNRYLEMWESIYGDEKKDRNVSERFGYVITRACELTGKRVAILIDEYDKPLLNAFGNEELAREFRTILKAFYSNLKTCDRYIEIAMITGVARFSKVSVFSDLNNLRDISFEDEFAAICGITAEEIDRYFESGIQAIADRKGKSYDEVRDALRESYDGYHFAKVSPDIYNPFSLLNAFAAREIGKYWFRTGTPTYLVRLLEKADLNLPTLVPYEIDGDELEAAGILAEDPIPAFYQTGYLTIKEYLPRYETYVLDYPNKEVKEGFLKFLVPYYLAKTTADTEKRFNVSKFVRDVRDGKIESFMKSLDSLIAGVPYSTTKSAEDHFQTAIYLLFTLMGYLTRTEERTANGRIDLTVETDRYVYLFEFKIDKSARVAMDQIRGREYWRKFLSSGKEIYLVGANFNTRTRTLDSDYLIERP